MDRFFVQVVQDLFLCLSLQKITDSYFTKINAECGFDRLSHQLHVKPVPVPASLRHGVISEISAGSKTAC